MDLETENILLACTDLSDSFQTMHSTHVHVLYVVLLHMEIVGSFGTRWEINSKPSRYWDWLLEVLLVYSKGHIGKLAAALGTFMFYKIKCNWQQVVRVQITNLWIHKPSWLVGNAVSFPLCS